MPRRSFAAKLIALVRTCPAETGRWTAKGVAFVVVDDHLGKLLPTYGFCSVKSFVRQLNYHGFRTSHMRDGCWAFFSPCFHRDHPEGWVHIQPRQVSANKMPKIAFQWEEPVCHFARVETDLWTPDEENFPRKMHISRILLP